MLTAYLGFSLQAGYPDYLGSDYSSLVLCRWLKVLIFLASLLTFLAYPLSPFLWIFMACLLLCILLGLVCVLDIYTISLTTILVAIEHTIILLNL